MQPQIKSKVRCSDGVAGEVAHVIADPLALDLSHLVVRVNGTERQVPMTEVSKIQEDSVDLLCTSTQLAEFPVFARENFLSSKEVEIPHLEENKSNWVVKTTPDILRNIYPHGDLSFFDKNGNVIWVNKATVPYVAYSGKCPHLGCGYKWRSHKTRGQVFLCPCHLSIYDVTG